MVDWIKIGRDETRRAGETYLMIFQSLNWKIRIYFDRLNAHFNFK